MESVGLEQSNQSTLANLGQGVGGCYALLCSAMLLPYLKANPEMDDN